MANLSKASNDNMSEHEEEPKDTGVTMSDLPELPLEKILGYLSLMDRVMLRAVSRRFLHVIDSFKVKSLCIAHHDDGSFKGISPWISEQFAQNFVISARFPSFLQTFGHSILSNLKHLRVYRIFLEGNAASAFAQALKSFSRLEELDIVRLNYLLHGFNTDLYFKLELNLPMLTSISLKASNKISLTLNAPKLTKINLNCDPRDLKLNLVHAESVERLIIYHMLMLEVDKLKNLQILYIGTFFDDVHPALLIALKHLRAIYVNSYQLSEQLFKRKKIYGLKSL